ncbi:ATP-dependent DNA helicase, partial [Hyphopichia burtonii NRRL Y-1933]
KKTKPNDLGKDDVQLLQDYIRICEAKINLLNEKNSITESTSISVDDKQKFFNLKFKPRFDKINNNQVKLRSKLLFLNNDSIDDTDLINSLSENPSPAKQDSLNQLDGIDFTSDFSDTNIDDAPPSPNQLKMNLEEARQIVLNTKSNHPPPPAPLPHSDNDDEDDFGNNTFEGLYTPPNEADDNYDLSDFIDDNDDASVDDSYRETQVRLESENNNIIVDDDEINNLKLSQDVADKLGVNYNVANSEIDLVSDVDDNSTMNDKKPNLEEKEFEDTVEEIDDLDCTTQFNQERELNNHDIIEISSDDDDDDDDIGNRNDDEIDEIVSSSIPTFPAKTQKPIPISNDSDFGDTDDEELLELMNNNSSKSTLPSSTQLPQDIPPGSEPFIKDVYSVLLRVFKLPDFRPNQLTAITSALMGKDVFVLMPTGGGKSLCYQLPALIKSGKTKGTTIVISPLISLMQDQVQHLINKNIKASMISSRDNEREKNSAIKFFKDGLLDLVYLSPEMINTSTRIQNIIDKLFQQNLLARVVVDEAHCVSSWGHDFRPDYKNMNMFKQKYPSLPLMALTATANEKVRLDIIHHLNMDDPILLKQSFNRTNLYYEVRPKISGYLDWIKDYISTKQKNKSGIIYCHSKQLCETTSDKLNSWGIKASFYHAGLDPNERFKIQQLWQNNHLQVICATIAFGMGIDKPDVRYVIHLFIPRNLEGYYQETGRAGRDGKPSECYLFFHSRDAVTIQNFIQRDDSLDDIGKESHSAKLRQVKQYCENISDCRRQQVLLYFNEKFDPKNCNKNCDNCARSNKVKTIEKDFTEHAKNILLMVKSIQNQNVTMLQFQDIYKGSRNAKILQSNFHYNEYHGKGSILNKIEIERIFFHLICESYLVEYQIMKGGFASNYLKLGRKANLILEKGAKVIIMISEESLYNSRPNSNKKRAPALNRSNTFAAGSTNINLNEFRFNSFVSAREELIEQNSSNKGSIIELPNNEFSKEIDEGNKQHVEFCYKELNNLRIQKSFELGYGQSNNFINEPTLKDMSIKLPTNKKDFIKLKNLNKDQQEYFMHFKKLLMQLSRERKKISNGTQDKSPYFNTSEQDQQILNELRNTYSQNKTQSRTSGTQNRSSQNKHRVHKPKKSSQRSQ